MEDDNPSLSHQVGAQLAPESDAPHCTALAESIFWLTKTLLNNLQQRGLEEQYRPCLMEYLTYLGEGFVTAHSRNLLTADILEEMFRTTPTAVLFADEQGRITLANPHASRLFGYEPQELVGQTIEILVPHPLHQRHIQHRQDYLRNPQTRLMGVTHDLRAVAKDGRLIPVDIGLSMVDTVQGHWTMVIVADLTSIRQLAYTERLLRTAIENVPVGILVSNKDRQAILTNSTALGGSVAEGMTPTGWFQSWEFCHPDGRPFPIDELPFNSAILQGKTTVQQEVLVRRRGETEFQTLLVTAAPIRQENGEIEAGIAVFQNITDRKKREANYRHTQKLESIGILAGGIAHDFNNILTAIMAENTLALHKLPPDHPAHKPIQNALRGVDRAAALTRQLLSYAGKEKSEITAVDLAQLLEDNASLLEAMIPHGVQVFYDFEPNLPLVQGFVGQLQQVAMNLILNAGEAYDGRVGHVHVLLRHEYITAENMPNGLQLPLAPGHYVCLQVADKGKGMTPTTLTKLFEPFFTTKLTGRGLGLAAVLGIVEDHGGSIQVQSVLDEGTLFRVYLPCKPVAVSPTAIAAPPSYTPVPVPNHHHFALLVDDERSITRTMSEILSMAGYTPLVAHQGEEALSLFYDHQDRVDAAVIDVNMGAMNGDELATKLLQQKPNLPVVLMTGYGSYEMESLRERPNVAILHKPFGLEQLLNALRAAGRPNPQRIGTGMD